MSPNFILLQKIILYVLDIRTGFIFKRRTLADEGYVVELNISN